MGSSINPESCGKHAAKTFKSKWSSALAKKLTEKVCATYEDGCGINHLDGSNMPQSEAVIEILHALQEVLFPGYSGRHPVERSGVEFMTGGHINTIFRELSDQIERALAYRCRQNDCRHCNCRRQAEDATIALLEKLPSVRELLKSDVQAAMDGDPAAKTPDEVVIAYPGLRAIAIQRIAHVLYKEDVPLIPRVMSEYAHTVTGIDIHPGATIGPRLFIDHGTGVVIGETSIIGANVKIYQGVTLGALSFPKDSAGHIIKGAKRHPNIEDNVTIYAGATILGDVTIGHDSIIGGNVWLTETVPAFTKITIAQPDLSIQQRRQPPPSAPKKAKKK